MVETMTKNPYYKEQEDRIFLTHNGFTTTDGRDLALFNNDSMEVSVPVSDYEAWDKPGQVEVHIYPVRTIR